MNECQCLSPSPIGGELFSRSVALDSLPGFSAHFLSQGIFPTQGLIPHLLHWQVNSLPLSHQGSPAVESVVQQLIELSDSCLSRFLSIQYV